MQLTRQTESNVTGGFTGANQHATAIFNVQTEDGRVSGLTVDSCKSPVWDGAALTDDEREEALALASEVFG